MEYNLESCLPKYAKTAELMGCDISGMSERDAAEAAVAAVGVMVSSLDLDGEIGKVRSEKVDTSVYGDNASRMFLIKNNPRKADAEDCRKIFEKIFS